MGREYDSLVESIERRTNLIDGLREDGLAFGVGGELWRDGIWGFCWEVRQVTKDGGWGPGG